MSFERLRRSRGSATLPGICRLALADSLLAAATRLFKSKLRVVAETPDPSSKYFRRFFLKTLKPGFRKSLVHGSGW
jgi:hypothetical protein